MKLKLAFVAATATALLAAPVAGKSIVREFSGSATATTAQFVVEGPWLLDWRLDGDFEALVALDIALIDAKTGLHIGRVLHTKRKGNGLKLFNEGGVYKLRVSTTLGRWRIKIEQITPEEVEQYTPARQPAKPFYE